jgi:hypothetical protein
MLPPLEPRLSLRWRIKTLAPAPRTRESPQPGCQPAPRTRESPQPGCQSPPVGHVAAAGACHREAGGQVCERKLRRQDGEHHGLTGLEIEGQQDDGVYRDQP